MSLTLCHSVARQRSLPHHCSFNLFHQRFFSSISATNRLAQHPCCFFTPTASNHLLFCVKCFAHFAMQHSGDDAQQCFAKFGKSNLASSEVLCKSSAIKHGQMWRFKVSRNSKTKAVKKQSFLLQPSVLRTSKHDSHSDLTIKSDTGRHPQFLRHFRFKMFLRSNMWANFNELCDLSSHPRTKEKKSSESWKFSDWRRQTLCFILKLCNHTKRNTNGASNN